ncbi:MAG: type II secretion system F family protein [Actinobacteria bacterium]|nr:type II secretion system F family protein [Actinomycetota bacterium]
MTALAGMAGGLVVSGLLLVCRELTRRVPPAGTPPRIRVHVSRHARSRAFTALAAGTAALLVTRWPVAMIAAVLGVLFLPKVMSGRASQQQAAMLEGLEQWTRKLSDMLSAGRGLDDALESSARRAPAAVAPAVAALSRRLAGRVPAEAALREFAADIADPAGDRIAAALIIATGHRGGAVRDVLHALAAMLARDIAARREIEADRAQHRTTVRWLTLFVLGFTVLAIVNRAYSAPFSTVTGQVVMAVVIALYAAGLGWLHRLGSIPVPGRFLDRAGDRRQR